VRLSEQAALAKLGEMAAVVAHEVKNPLAGIRGAVQVFGSRLSDDAGTKIVKEIIARIDALDGLMKDLLLFARPPQPKYSPTEVLPLVASIANLMSQDPSASGVDVDIAGEARRSPRTLRCFASSSRTS
jgi:nitrogen-specific signal transduction histidine kinase